MFVHKGEYESNEYELDGIAATWFSFVSAYAINDI